MAQYCAPEDQTSFESIGLSVQEKQFKMTAVMAILVLPIHCV